MALLKSITFPNGNKYEIPAGGIDFTKTNFSTTAGQFVVPLISYETENTHGTFNSVIYCANNIYTFEGAINKNAVILSITSNNLPLNSNSYELHEENGYSTLWVKLSSLSTQTSCNINTTFYGTIIPGNDIKSSTSVIAHQIPNRLCCYVGTTEPSSDLPIGSLYIQYSESQIIPVVGES